jgi:prepilin-type N-terminal cleavage/methylation domain-containing protein
MRIDVKTRSRGFTLAEVLAALVFMAIVIPVALEALRISNLAGQVGLRKGAAARVAERVLNESLITSQIQGLSQTGVVDEGQQQYRWTIRSEPWTEDTMLMVSVEVLFQVQGKDYDVRLSTLVNNSSP